MTIRTILAFSLLLAGAVSSLSADEGDSSAMGEKEYRNIVYKTVDGQELKLNLFVPTRGGEPMKNVPLLIWLDSGGYHSDQPSDGAFWRSTGGLQKGFALASVTHRSLNRGDTFPKQIEDLKAAVRFLRAHASEYGIDPTRFAAMGASSGGHLACMLGLSDKYRLFDVGENLEYSSQVQRVVDACGTTYMPLVFINYPSEDVLRIITSVSNINFDRTKPIWEQPELNEPCVKYSAITYADADYAPTLIIQGLKDPLIMPSQSRLFYEALQKVGVRSEVHFYPEAGHGVLGEIPPAELETTLYNFLQW